MKKRRLLLGLILVVITSCEKDDYCIKNPVTPHLVLRFYDDSNKEALKSVDELYVWAAGKDSLFSGVQTDSIYIPLNSTKTETIYYFSNGTSVNTFTISYTPEEEYVSRSCGYKMIYQGVNFTSNTTWIKNFTPTTLTTITSDNAAHVQIYH
ncbi:MAG: DUF6452 family protein [Polaribacter sp.]|jgi:hypothetical protein|nr:DUF6452 family protein [Polaribacter sp.]MDG2357587.1 DUF6452 family protein [Polaribacter sp.]